MSPRALIGLAALALVTTAALVLRPAREPASVPPEQTAPLPPPASRPSSRAEPTAEPTAEPPTRTLGDALEALRQPPEPAMQLPPTEARREAEASFEHIMQTLEDLADAGQRVPAARRDELYRNTNDAFAALSATLDPNSAADMQALEDANIRMRAMLHEAGVRVPRRPKIVRED